MSWTYPKLVNPNQWLLNQLMMLMLVDLMMSFLLQRLLTLPRTLGISLETTNKNSPLNYKNPLQVSKCTPSFCDGMSKGNQNTSSKEGGEGERLKCAKFACKAWSSSSMSTKI